jgi:hypothetical protein
MIRLKPAAERLDKIYFCALCRACFLFKSDTEDHEMLYNHSEFKIRPFE